METKQKFSTAHLEALRALRIEEKAIKARIDLILPLAKQEAIAITDNKGGKFPVEGVGEFILDVNPIFEKTSPIDPVPDIRTSRDEDAVNYRENVREQNKLKAKSKALAKSIKGFYDAFKAKYKDKATRFTYTLKCVDLE